MFTQRPPTRTALLWAGATSFVLACPVIAWGQPVGQKMPGQPQIPQVWNPAPAPAQPRPPTPFLSLMPTYLALLAVFIAAKKQAQDEEEEMSTHMIDPVSFEFKIFRSNGAFKNRDKLRAMLDEEARAGWEMFELLDTSRVRLKRATTWRDKDTELTQDSYRTRIGGGNPALVVGIIAAVVISLALVFALVFLINK